MTRAIYEMAYAEAVGGLIETVSKSAEDSLSLISEEMNILKMKIEENLK